MAKMLSLIGAAEEVSSEGSIVTAASGDRYLDCGGYGVFLHGHCHPKVVGAVVEQVRKHPLPTHALLEPTVAHAAGALSAIAPGELDYVFFTNSGAEAVELGLKVARANGRYRVISTEGGFHGKTLGALSVTGKPGYRKSFEPLLPEVQHIPFGDAGRLHAALRSGAGGSAAVLIEPVQGEGGVREPPTGYLSAVRELCDRFDALLLMDEVQTGLGRLGTMWGCEIEGVVPDVLLVGKILGGGVFPVGAMVTTADLYEPFNADPLLHSSTFGGSPAAAAAVLAALEALREENLVSKAAVLGEQLLNLIRDAVARHAHAVVHEVRGRGLMIGIDFLTPAVAADVMSELLTRKVLTSYTLNSNEVLRLTPPAAMTAEEVDWLIAALAASCQVVNARFRRREEGPDATVHYARLRSVC
jgi:putrescine aminotransferase